MIRQPIMNAVASIIRESNNFIQEVCSRASTLIASPKERLKDFVFVAEGDGRGREAREKKEEGEMCLSP